MTATTANTTTPYTRDQLATVVQTYRKAARLVRAKYRRPNPLARDVAPLISIRDRAMTIIDAVSAAALAAHHAEVAARAAEVDQDGDGDDTEPVTPPPTVFLAETIRDEDALLHHLGFLRQSGLDRTGARAALDAARKRRREILAAITH